MSYLVRLALPVSVCASLIAGCVSGAIDAPDASWVPGVGNPTTASLAGGGGGGDPTTAGGGGDPTTAGGGMVEEDAGPPDAGMPDAGPEEDAGTGIDNDSDGFDSASDCNDNDPDINPGATEICNGRDDNCTGGSDEGVCQANCDGYTLGGRAYMICSSSRVYNTAVGVCGNEGMSLARINSASENSLVRTSAAAQVTATYWVSGTDNAPSTAGRWVHLQGSAIVETFFGPGTTAGSYHNFGAGQPGGDPANCLRVDHNSGAWITDSCNASHPFVCELQ